jgi:methyl-accepting chemotaxis protein
MFIISQYLLYQTKICNYDNITTYAIGSGVIIYAAIYLYLLFNNTEYLSLFNKFMIYIISIDLLLSTFFYFNTEKSHKQNFQNQFDTDTNSDSNSEDEESEFEIETDDNFDFYENKEDSYNTNTNVEYETEYLEMRLDNQVNEVNEITNDLNEVNEITNEVNEITNEVNEITNEVNEVNEITNEVNEVNVIANEVNEITIEKTNIQNNGLKFVPLDNSDFVDDNKDIIELETIVKKKRGRKPNSLKLT